MDLKQLTFSTLLAEQCVTQGDRPCILFEGRTYSYADVDRLSSSIAGGLVDAGVRHGTKVAILIDNKPEIVLLYLGLAKIGAVAVPLNTAAKGELLALYIEKSDAEYAVCDSEYVARIAAILDRTTIKAVYSIDEHNEVEADALSCTVTLRDFRELVRHAAVARPDLCPKHIDPFMLLYTSGTTGRSKASLATHHSALTIGLIMAEAYGYTPDDVLYICLPLFHGNAWQCATVPALVAGAAIAITRRFSTSAFWKEVRECGATQFNIMSSMTNFLWSQPASSADRDHRVKQCMLVPTPAAFYDEFKQRFGIVAIQSLYALTDVGVVSITTSADPESKRLSAGKPNHRFDVQIVGEEDEPLPVGTTGEIVVRNREPWIMPRGYYNDWERTVTAWQNLWFHTGDRGYFDEDGYLYFVDRKKDAIRRRGENISSYEVEQIILKHPAVRDAAAYPLASEHSEDEVAVSVIVREGSELSEKQLIEHCRENMPYFMVPRYLEFTETLPCTMTGKVEKYKLQQSASNRMDKIWDREKVGIKISR